MRRPPALAAAAILLATIGWGVALPAQQATSGAKRRGGVAARPAHADHASSGSRKPERLVVRARRPGRRWRRRSPTSSRACACSRKTATPPPRCRSLSQGALASTPLADYARFYTGKALLELRRYPEAEAAFAAVASRNIEGHLPEDAAIGRAQAREARVDFAGAVAVYDELLQRKLAAPHAVLSRLGGRGRSGGQRCPKAIEAFRRVYFEYPLSTESSIAEAALTRLNAWSEDEPQTALELKRADALFQARRWEAARTSYERARDGATGAERDRVALRMAACRRAAEALSAGARSRCEGRSPAPTPTKRTSTTSARLRGLGERDEYERLGRSFADSRTESPFAQEMLNNLASHFIVADDDDRADEVFRMHDRALSRRALHRARLLALGLVGLSRGQVCRGRQPVRSRRRAVPALRLPSVLDLLERARLAGGRQRRAGQRSLHAHGHRLLQQLLRPAGAQATGGAARRARWCRSSRGRIRRRRRRRSPPRGGSGS